MRTNLIISILALCSVTVFSQKNEWKDPKINEVNRLQMHASYFAYESEQAALDGTKENSDRFLSLNGLWRFNWVKNADERPTDFYTVGYNDKGWAYMNVPALWELNGYGDPMYVNVGYPWRNQFKSDPPNFPEENNHVGSYRREITIPAGWTGQQVIAHFGSVTSNIYLWVNGKFVGYSEDSKLEAEFDVTPYLKSGKNLFAFQTFRWCDGTYLEDQDFFRLSGVGRDCYLYARDKKHIADIRITPDLDAQYQNGTLDVEISLSSEARSSSVQIDLLDPQLNKIKSETLKGAAKVKTALSVDNPHKWTAETPSLYKLVATLKDAGGKTIEVIALNAGFRKVEIKNAQLLVNGKAILIKGANRHEMDPKTGYYISPERMLQDIRIMKEYNLNAVRPCHYPDDALWYDLCDEYGLYVVAEANVESHGMGYGETTLAKNPLFDVAHLQRNQRNVQRNYNHPSVIIWSMGNEAGFGPNFEACYKWIKAEDKTRPVQYERDMEGNCTDIICPMYYSYTRSEQYANDASKTKPLIQCEYAHAMGNSQGGFKEYWELFRKYPKLQGGFIWDFVDQSLYWKNADGVTIYGYGGDFNRYDASDLNFCDNGLIAPSRIPNPHMDEVGYYYQSIWATAGDLQKGEISVYNENFFRDLSAYYLDWAILADGKIALTGTVPSLNVAPQQTVKLSLGYDAAKLPKDKELLLNVCFKLKQSETLLPAGFVVARNQLVINPYAAKLAVENEKDCKNCPIVAPTIKDNDFGHLIILGEQFDIEFNKRTGFLDKYVVDGKDLIKDGSALKPNFWRAPTDNDFGANLQTKYRVWLNPEIRLVSLDKQTVNGAVEVKASYEMKDVQGKLFLAYIINNKGAIQVSQKFEATAGAGISNMFRFGMKVEMPANYESIHYYGRGPIENYSDRNNSTFIGEFRQTVDEQFYSYIRPQETGTKTDIRWWRLTDTAGDGLEFISEAPFSASALHYTIESLDEGLRKNQHHSPEIPQANLTQLCIDKVQMGLGCVNSWGALPLEKYMVPYGNYEFTFVIKPIVNDY